jgi:selenocysteine-specific elongation factor
MSTLQSLDITRRSTTTSPSPSVRESEEVAKLIDISKCIGCKACQAACYEWNDLRDEIGVNVGVYDNPPDLTENSWTLMRFTEVEEDGNHRRRYRPRSLAPDRGRRRPQRLAALAAMSEADACQALARLASADPGWIDLEHFARARNLTVEKSAALRRITGIVCVESDGAAFGFGSRNWQLLKQATVMALAGHHEKARDSPGLETHRLRLAVDARLPIRCLRCRSWCATARCGAMARGSSSPPTPFDSPRRTSGCGRIRAVMERTRFQPPRVRDFSQTLGASEAQVRQLLRRLARMGTLVEVAHDHFYTRTTIAELAATVQRIANGNPEGKITAAVFRDRIGTGRKLAIQILEFFDRTGITIR